MVFILFVLIFISKIYEHHNILCIFCDGFTIQWFFNPWTKAVAFDLCLRPVILECNKSTYRATYFCQTFSVCLKNWFRVASSPPRWISKSWLSVSVFSCFGPLLCSSLHKHSPFRSKPAETKDQDECVTECNLACQIMLS